MFGVSEGAKEESVCGLYFSVVAFVSLSLSGPTHEVIMIHTHTTVFFPPPCPFPRHRAAATDTKRSTGKRWRGLARHALAR